MDGNLGIPRTAELLAGGRLRCEPADFRVVELPLYELSGSGEHLFLKVEKTGLTTGAMVDRMARALRARPRDIGVAGLKDRHAVTTQWISVQRVSAEDALALELPDMRVLEAVRHGNKLRTGHLRGNRFEILVRGDFAGRLSAVQAALEHLMREGLPNLHGPQRYGVRGDNAQLGAALVRGAAQEFLRILGDGLVQRESPRVLEARAAFAQRDAARALELFPRGFEVERHCAAAWQRGRDDAEAVRTLPGPQAQFLMNAWQSACFDAVLRARLTRGMALLRGDIAMKVANGASFLVEDAAAETPRALAQEIVPTGPLPGSRLLRPEGEPRSLEDDALRGAGCDPDALDSIPLNGARRAMLVRVQDADAVAESEGLRLRFTLPAGSFATTLLEAFGATESREERS